MSGRSRSGSLGGHRRSVSLTSRISRPSVGAQRVSGAAFDRGASGGNSTILLFLATLEALFENVSPRNIIALIVCPM